MPIKNGGYKKMKIMLSKKLLSVLLVIALTVSLFPGVVASAVNDGLLAEEEYGETVVEETASAAQEEETEEAGEADDAPPVGELEEAAPIQLFGSVTYELPPADAPYFVFVAETGNTLIAPPQLVYYEEGESLLDALLRVGVTFDRVEYISEVNGISGNFTKIDNNGNFDLNAPASETAVLRISEDTELSSFMADLLITMARYMLSDEGAKNYPAAKSAYETLLNAYIGITESGGAAYVQTLNTALDAYAASNDGDAYTVTFTAANESRPEIRMVSVTNLEYLNVYTSADGVFDLVAGNYSFSYASGQDRVEGSFAVTNADKQIAVSLPTADWLASFDFYSARPDDADSYIYPKDENSSIRERTHFVPDMAGTVNFGTNKGTAYFKIRRSGAVGVPDSASLRADYVPYYQNTGAYYAPPSGISWESNSTGFIGVYTAGLNPQSFAIEVSYTGADGYRQIQTYTANIVKTPTLAALTVSGGTYALTADKPLGAGITEYAFNVPTAVTTAYISAQAFGSAAEGYSVEVNGQSYTEGAAVSIPTGQQSVSHEVTVISYGGQRTVYTLTFNRAETVSVSFSVDGETSVAVMDADGNIVAPSGANRYDLIKGNTYKYIATKGTHYHARQTFTADYVRTFAVVIDTNNRVSGMELRSGARKTVGVAYPLTPSFSGGEHEYGITVPDYNSSVYIWVNGDAGVSYRAEYSRIVTNEINGTLNAVDITSNQDNGKVLSYLLLAGGRSTEITVTAFKTQGDIEYYQEYHIAVGRSLSVARLGFALKGRALPLSAVSTEAVGFNRELYDYRISVADNIGAVTMSKTNLAEAIEYGTTGGSYTLSLRVNGGTAVDVTNLAEVEVELTRSMAADVITLEVRHADPAIVNNIYNITVLKTEAITAGFTFSPSDALFTLLETETNSRIWANDDDGRYNVAAGFTYRYTLTKSGYIGISETFTVTAPENLDMTLSLALAPESVLNTGLDAQWPTFRGNFDNNGITNAPTATKPEDAVLYWATKIGEGYATNATGSPILVDGYIYTYSGSHVYKVDRLTGKIAATGSMDHGSSFSITPPTYAEGMVFVGLSEGCIQAFDAVTLKSLWIYRDPLKGQPNSTIEYHNGYIYTGFWVGEDKDANFVCISITDEDHGRTNEEKFATWTHTQKGGFYWAGATLRDNYLLVGTDDGYTGYSHSTANLLSVNPLTGKVIDKLTGLVGDVRSNIVYDASSGYYYFTGKGGYFYGVKVNGNGEFDRESFWSLRLQNGSSGGVPMSTSTPVVHNGRAYIGVSGESQFGEYGGHNISVINLPTRAVAYRLQTKGYPQTSGLLTTAYEASTGYVYVYFIDNYQPGVMRVLKDKAGQIAPLEGVIEGGVTCAQPLFTPYGAHAEYAISSPIADEYGTMYYKNDTGHMFALGSAITGLTMTQAPNKTEYEAGEMFDPAGMKVVAAYANGMTRDVTGYVVYSREPLVAGADEEFIVVYDKVLYQDKNGIAGISFPQPYFVLNLTIAGGGVMPGDVDLNGRVNMADVTRLMEIIIGRGEYTTEQSVAADVDGNGRVNMVDLNLCMKLVLNS